MITRYLLLIAALCCSFFVEAQELIHVKGVVYHDLNSNGRRDKAEQGLADVAVSNGSEVVVTDKTGNYQLFIPAADGQVFVIKPSAFNYPVNEKNLPQFYYLHKPNGSPKMKFETVPASGPLPESVDFGLLTGCDTEVFSIIIGSDPQPYNEEQVDFYKTDIVNELKSSTEAVIGFTLGDIVGDRPDLFAPMNAATSEIGLPWFHVLGNHDMNYDATVAAHADESFERNYGPSTYSFNQGKVHFFVLNDVIYPNTFNNQQYIGGFTERQFAYLENVLKTIPKDYLLVFMMHIPLYNESQHGETFINTHRERFFSLLEDRPYTFSLSGHTHTQRQYFFDAHNGWNQPQPHQHYTVGTASGDWWSGAPTTNGVPMQPCAMAPPMGITYCISTAINTNMTTRWQEKMQP